MTNLTAEQRVFGRPADFIIGGAENPYMFRWWIIPRNRFFNIYLHHIVRDDDDRALHDHPWANISIVLKGGYFEVMGQASLNGAALAASYSVGRPRPTAW